VAGGLIRNNSLHFRCKQVHLSVENNQTEFTNKFSPKQIIRVPIAHGEGNYVVSNDELKTLEDQNQIAFRYCDSAGNISDDHNPNGSVSNIAGVFNNTKTILGMMPHPEDAVTSPASNNDGRPLFQSIYEALA
jgi:phosphoribosylformylglycinamidine synthase